MFHRAAYRLPCRWLRYVGLVGILVVLASCGVRETQAPPDPPAPTSAPADGAYPPAEAGATTPPAAAYPPPTEGADPQPPADDAAAIPPCTFPLGTSQPAGEPLAASLNTFIFSEPEVVLTGAKVRVAEWLPDNQLVLITTRRPEGGEQIALFDPFAQSTEVLATRRELGSRPMWLAATEQVAFEDWDAADQSVLQLSATAPGGEPTTLTPLAAPATAAHPDGSVFVAFVGTGAGTPTLFARQGDQMREQTLAPQMAALERTVNESGSRVLPWYTTWSPQGDLVAVHNAQGFYLVDPTTGTTCTIDFGSTPGPEKVTPWWVGEMHWSPNGRYLLLELAAGTTYPPDAQQNVLLDMTTGHTQVIDLDVPTTFDFAWAPDSRYLLALGKTDVHAETRVPYLGLFLIDVTTRESRQILPDSYRFSLGTGFMLQGGHMEWSPDGQTVVVRCTTREQDQLCKIAVEGV